MTVPTPLGGACAWRGEEMAASTRWVRTLDAADVAEIDDALGAARASGAPWPETTRERFPLPRFAAKLDEVARELEDGGGLVALRGLPWNATMPPSSVGSGSGSGAIWAGRSSRTGAAS